MEFNALQPQTDIVISIPSWLPELVASDRPRHSVEERMELVLEMVARNIDDGGGPFAAGVFDAEGHLVGAGVNRVVPASAAIAHAEMVAIAAAGQRLGTWNLGASGPRQLVTSTEPCAMCPGAVPWSGVSSMATGARDSDARAVGFDEGDKMSNWTSLLEARGITVIRDVLREQSVKLLDLYAQIGGEIYNG